MASCMPNGNRDLPVMRLLKKLLSLAELFVTAVCES